MKPAKLPAQVRISRRPSGWYCWHLGDAIGSTLTHLDIVCSGFEKTKTKALEMAQKARTAFNALPVIEEPRRPRQGPVCARSGEDCEVFSRR